MPVMAAFDQGQTPTITFVNKATIPLGVNFDALIGALQKQVTRDFAPVWGDPANLKQADMPVKGTWTMLFVDDAGVPDALGFHDLLKGFPVSYVSVKAILAAGEDVGVTASHELLEMLEDADVSGWKLNPKTKLLWAWEMCDAVEETVYLIDGVKVSNFIYPSFFESWRAADSTKFDYMGELASPYGLLHGGYTLLLKSGRMSQRFAHLSDHPTNQHMAIAFGSEEKKKRFLKEDRRLHRSEFRLSPLG